RNVRHRVAVCWATRSENGTPTCRQRDWNSTGRRKPMQSLLVIKSSAAREGSVSRTLVEEAVARLLEANPFAKVVRRDLGANPVPHLSVDTLAGVRGVPATP